VLQHGERFVVGEARAEQGRAGAFREPVLAGPAGQHATLLAGAIAERDAEVALSALTVIGALAVLTAEAVEVFHESGSGKCQFGILVNSSSAL